MEREEFIRYASETGIPYFELVIPPAVAREIEPSVRVLPAWVSVPALSSQPAPFTSRGPLGDGEREAIALSIEIGADAVLIDERAGRRVAEEAGLKVIGTLGLLLEAKRADHLTTIRRELDTLLETSFFLSQQLYDQALRIAGEQGT